MDVKLVYDALQELDALKFLKVSFKFYMSSTTCSMMSLMESILTTELAKSFKQLAG